ncbi:hypothetical protein LZ480_10225 [Solibacillus sp. MA9]|uniref:Uncharacterized protein n=1 Tax=Solibacillus palustris TaxID=2908203 RepID=A0ABS9UE55_9BACL|nr:hypothetical protein [Solibacillus sp. MA9]MCH7322268.1 hypothetical protein [Solibacillus sp. MA9]
MMGFKKQLRQELQQDAPFTNDLKQRLLQTKPTPKKQNWQVLSVSVAVCCLIGMLLIAQFAPQKSVLTASESETLLPLLDDVTGLEVIEPSYARLLGEQWMLESLPMVIDKDAPITYGDYVAYYTPGGIIVSTVLGLANDSVTMDEGQITVNGTVLKVRGLGEKLTEMNKRDPFLNPYYFQEHGVTFSSFANETIKAAKDELLVYQNVEQHQLLKINEGQLAGKVTAIQASDELALTLTAEEQAVFEAFKIDHDLERLRHISPVVIAKMYLLSEIEMDFPTYEALFTTAQSSEIFEVKAYYEKTKALHQQLFTPELNRILIATYFNGLQEGEFEQDTDTEGWVMFTGENGLPAGVGMAKNEQGIWQPSFVSLFIPTPK